MCIIFWDYAGHSTPSWWQLRLAVTIVRVVAAVCSSTSSCVFCITPSRSRLGGDVSLNLNVWRGRQMTATKYDRWRWQVTASTDHVHWPCTVDHDWPPPTALYASSTSLHESRPSPTIPVVGVQSYRTRGYITPECRALYPCRPSTYNDGGGRLRHAEWVLLRNNSTQRRSKSQVSRRAVLMAYRTRLPVNLQTPVSHAHSTCLEWLKKT